MKFGALCRAHDGFVGNVVGWYFTREGERGVVLQERRTSVVRTYRLDAIEECTNQKPSANESGEVKRARHEIVEAIEHHGQLHMFEGQERSNDDVELTDRGAAQASECHRRLAQTNGARREHRRA